MFDEAFTPKLLDFGLSKHIKGSDNSDFLRTDVGTFGYMAPEVYQQKYKGIEADMFALGVFLFVVTAIRPPWKEAKENDVFYRLIYKDRPDIFWKFQHKQTPGVFSNDLVELITSLTQVDGSQRPTA